MHAPAWTGAALLCATELACVAGAVTGTQAQAAGGGVGSAGQGAALSTRILAASSALKQGTRSAVHIAPPDDNPATRSAAAVPPLPLC